MWRVILILSLTIGCGCNDRSAKPVPASAPTVAPATADFERSDVITLTPLAAQKVREMSRVGPLSAFRRPHEVPGI
jgi:hypothetical protein